MPWFCERCFGVELEAEVSRLWGLVAGLSQGLVCCSSVVHISDAVSWVFGYGKAVSKNSSCVAGHSERQLPVPQPALSWAHFKKMLGFLLGGSHGHSG